MKSEYISVKPYTFNTVIEEDGIDDDVLRDYIIFEFAQEFFISYSQAEHIIQKMCLMEILIDRYWDKFYKSLGGK